MENYDYLGIYNIEALKENSYSSAFHQGLVEKDLEIITRKYIKINSDMSLLNKLFFTNRMNKKSKQYAHRISELEEELNQIDLNKEDFIFGNLKQKYKQLYKDNSGFVQNSKKFYDLLGKEMFYDRDQELLEIVQEGINNYSFNKHDELDQKIKNWYTFNQTANMVYSNLFIEKEFIYIIEDTKEFFRPMLTISQTQIEKINSDLELAKEFLNEKRTEFSREIKSQYAKVLFSLKPLK